MHAIWHIPELLAHILLFLDAKDIVPSYHICRVWRETLKSFPPHHHHLPDGMQSVDLSVSFPQSFKACEILPNKIREFASMIQKQEEQWTTTDQLAGLGDDYFYWKQGAFANVLEMLLPHLHPFLAKHSRTFVSGLAFVAEGRLKIGLRTECALNDYFDLVDDEMSELGWLPLTQPPCTSVEVCCLKGGNWDRTYANVHDRGLYHSVWIERKMGVRISDVRDELRGSSVEGRTEPLVDQMLLEWHFNGTQS